jgi:histidinol dehydrogenase
MTIGFLNIDEPDSIDDCSKLFEKDIVFDPEITKLVTDIIEDIKNNGDNSLLKYCREFDSFKAKSPGELIVSDKEISEAVNIIREKFPDLVNALKVSYENLKEYHTKQFENESREWFIEEKGSKKLGQLIRPVEKLGIYIPGGRFIYPSSVLMTSVPAIIAGVKNITICTPPLKDGSINKVLLYVFDFMGIKKIYRIGGAQAIAALAVGTETIESVDKIVGPGNIYVTIAKKIVYGITGIDSLAGPSEIVIIADASANPSFIAADLISQAEHDPLSRSILLTTSKNIAEEVLGQVYIQLNEIYGTYPDRFTIDLVTDTLKNNCSIVFNPDIDFLIALCNLIAPEHLEIIVADEEQVLSGIKNAGAVFTGNYTPVAAGDYICGTNHVIPTGGNARFSSPLGVYDFLKKTSFAHYEKEKLEKEAKFIQSLADFENLLAHKNSIKVRFKK